MEKPVVPDKIYSVWNDASREFQFDIEEPTQDKAIHQLFKKIGQGARKTRYKFIVANVDERLRAHKALNKHNQLERNKAYRLKHFGTEDKLY